MTAALSDFLAALSPEDRARLAERFWSKVRCAGPDQCWLWTGKPNKNGYGRFYLHRRLVEYAHRLVWFLVNGVLPDLDVLHKCDNPPCVNPAHLFLGTQADNNRDMVGKGRHWMQQPGHHETALDRWNREHPERPWRGEAHPESKLTTGQVVEMRERYARGENRAALAREFDVARVTVCRIVIGQMWKHAAGPIVDRGNDKRPLAPPTEETQAA